MCEKKKNNTYVMKIACAFGCEVKVKKSKLL